MGEEFGDGLGSDQAAPGMTTSAALMPSPLTPPGTGGGTQSTGAAARMPMAGPMMPMHAMNAAAKNDGQGIKRDPVIFAERPLYEPAEGVDQVFGAPPEIESEEPPFGDGGAEAASR